MAFTKETAIEILVSGDIKGFNEKRPYDENNLLDFSELDFTEVDLAGANLSLADLNGANFTEMELENVDFSGSDLTSASFIRANIIECDFSGANLNGANFASANCYANFADADLSGADFSDGDFAESDFTLSINMSMCKFDKYTTWPDASDLPDDFDSTYVPDSDDEDDAPVGDYY